jgi:C_GCAxxG_C_C family probable redox protein
MNDEQETKMENPGTNWTIDADRMVAAADKYFMADDRSCSEAILRTGCEALGIQSDLIPDIALGLGGGIGLQGHVCGAISGAALVISLAMAKKVPDYSARKMATYEAVGRVCKTLEKQLGSVQCRQLCGLDLTQLEGLQKLMGGVKADKCAGFVKETASVLAEELRRIAAR